CPTTRQAARRVLWPERKATAVDALARGHRRMRKGTWRRSLERRPCEGRVTDRLAINEVIVKGPAACPQAPCRRPKANGGTFVPPSIAWLVPRARGGSERFCARAYPT